MLKDVSHKVTDGLLGFDTTKGEGVHVKIGVSAKASNTPITVIGSMSADKIKNLLGLSPLADSVMDSVQFGANRIYCVPVPATTAGALGQVSKTGDGKGNLAASGSPTNAFSIIIKITAQGGLNSAAFIYSIDGGNSYSEEATVPVGGSYELSDTGITIKFTESVQEEQNATSFVVGDIYSFDTTAPTMTNGDVISAIDKLKNFNEQFEFVHIVGGSTLPLWQAVSTLQVELRDIYHKPLFFVLEAEYPESSDDLTDWALALESDRKKIKNYDMQLVTAWGLLLKLDGSTKIVNLAGVASGLYTKAKVHESIGKTREESGFGISKDMLELMPGNMDNSIIEILDMAGFLTFREYDGLEDIFVYHTKMMCPDGSDYRYAEDSRVKNKIIRETRKEGLLLLNDDIDLEDVQGELETRAKFMFTPLQDMIDNQEISSAEITVPEGQNTTILEDGKMRVKIRYVSRGYIREVEVDLGRSQPQ